MCLIFHLVWICSLAFFRCWSYPRGPGRKTLGNGVWTRYSYQVSSAYLEVLIHQVIHSFRGSAMINALTLLNIIETKR